MICFWRWMIWSQRFWCCRNFKITISLRLIWNSLNRQADWVSVFSISSSCTLHSRLRISRWSSVLILLGIVCNKHCFYGHSLLVRSNTIIFFCFTRLIFCKIAIKLLSTIKTLVVNHQNTISFISHNENTIFKNYMQVSCCESLEFLVPQFFWISWITIIQKLTSSKKLWNIILIHTSYDYINKILSPRTCEKIKTKIGPNKIQIFNNSVYTN